MSKLKCYAVDDELSAINSLQYLLNEYCKQETEWEGSSTDYAHALEYLSGNEPDVLFLDINLGSKSGFDLLAALNKRLHSRVIMVTAYDQYALQAFKFNAVNYLLKPINPEELVKAVDRVFNMLVNKPLPQKTEHSKVMIRPAKTQSDKIFIPNRKGWISISINDIIYLKGEGSYTNIYLDEGICHKVSKNLRFFEAHYLLGYEKLKRIQKSYIVNTAHIRRLLRQDGGTLEMSDGSLIPISIQLRDSFLEHLGLG